MGKAGEGTPDPIVGVWGRDGAQSLGYVVAAGETMRAAILGGKAGGLATATRRGGARHAHEPAPVIGPLPGAPGLRGDGAEPGGPKTASVGAAEPAGGGGHLGEVRDFVLRAVNPALLRQPRVEPRSCAPCQGTAPSARRAPWHTLPSVTPRFGVGTAAGQHPDAFRIPEQPQCCFWPSGMMMMGEGSSNMGIWVWGARLGAPHTPQEHPKQPGMTTRGC